MRYWILKSAFCFLLLSLSLPEVFAQVEKITDDVEKDKPAKYKTKVLKSEKTGQKKFTAPRRFIQNTVSHYNYYFDANNKINQVIERARLGNTDNYFRLLSFYSYSLNNTASQAAELDSVIYKATAGILLHDLRSDWVDNFYLLIGKAYLLRKNFDSASMTFQFINYNLYPKKKKDDDKVVVGSNLNGEKSTVSIANKESSNFFTKTFKKPPSRNDALVWQIRTLIEMEEYPDAAGLINTLKNDPNFPARLKPYLEEVNAYWFYQQGFYDSAAAHLENALSNTSDIQERARSEYLLAQLYGLTKNRDKASEYYEKAIRHTTDPLLDIYANLSEASMYDSSGLNQIDKSISTLLHMARRDKFTNFKDIIYYSAAQIALEKPDTAMADLFLKRSIKYNESNLSFKNKAFLKLADINFVRKNYKIASAFYDSIQAGDSLMPDLSQIQQKKEVLTKIVYQINIIEREDSLQHIALMPEADREAFVKKLSKALIKQSGIKDDINASTASSAFDNKFDNKNVSGDIFASNNTKGDWYFYNAAAKSRGFSDFKSRWGKRENVDNWRLAGSSQSGNNNSNGNVVSINDVNNATNSNPNNPISGSKNINNVPQGVGNTGDVDAVNPNATNQDNSANNSVNDNGVTDISYEGMLANVPTTPDKLRASNTMLSNAIFELGKLYQNNLEDYETASETYENSLKRYPDSLHGGELYMNLYYCYQKLGNIVKSNYYKNLLTSKLPESRFAQFIKNPKASISVTKSAEATKRYEDIYNLFIEGNFDKALEEKKSADSLYANNYWSPQLLYIESVYYVKQRDDSQAIKVLNNIITNYPNSALKQKASTMIDVLRRRNEIEGYLTNLQIERVKEDSLIEVAELQVKKAPEIVRNNETKNPVTQVRRQDSIITKRSVPASPSGSFSFVANATQFVIMLLDKVDPVYISEARNALTRYNREKYYGQSIEIVKDTLDKNRNMLVFREFPDAVAALAYTEKIKKDAAGEISWLPANKYSFFIMSDANLQLLKVNKDLEAYLKLLRTNFPGKF